MPPWTYYKIKGDLYRVHTCGTMVECLVDGEWCVSYVTAKAVAFNGRALHWEEGRAMESKLQQKASV